MPSPDLDLRLAAAQAVVREAGELGQRYYRKRETLPVTRKGAQDLVSEADGACEDLIVSRLSRLFPDDGFLGEEGGVRLGGGEAVWIIDPIDGTHNFLTGVPVWCVSLALVVAGEAVLGLIYHPAEDELFAAQRGGGASLNGVPIRVSGVNAVTEARIGIGFSYRRPVANHARTVEALLTAGCEYCRLGSGALGLAYTAAGRFDGYWEHHTNAWDAAAGLVLVREAGGWTNDFLAGDGLAKGNQILAATPDLVDELAKLTLQPG
ncbi:MAG TPA: inositol monophosphatase family protein [Propylenella sp.]|nr:inositol monophosphatase family protein [Propylenella sp.]